MTGFMEGQLVSLKPIDFKNLDRYYRWTHHHKIRKYTDGYYAISKKALKENIKSGDEGRSTYYFEIFTSENHSRKQQKVKETAEDKSKSHPIGLAIMDRINFFDRHAEMKILIGEEEYWNRGIGTEVCKLLTDFGFGDLNLNKLHFCTPEANTAALRVADKAGYTLGAVLRDENLMGGKYVNENIYWLFNAEWLAQKNLEGGDQ